MRVSDQTKFSDIVDQFKTVLPTEKLKHLRSEGQELHTHGVIPHGKGRDAAIAREAKVLSAASKVRYAIDNQFAKKWGPGFSGAVFNRVAQRHGTDLSADGVRVKDLGRIKLAISEEIYARANAESQTIMGRNDPNFGLRVLVAMGQPLDTPLNPLGCDAVDFRDAATTLEVTEHKEPRTAPYADLSPQDFHRLSQMPAAALTQALVADQQLATRVATMSKADLAILAFRNGSANPNGDAQRMIDAIPNQYTATPGGQNDSVTIVQPNGQPKQYDFVKNLGAGGYGDVKLFRAADGEQVVLKHERFSGVEANNPAKSPAQFRRAANEIRQHQALASSPAGQSVVGFKGAVRQGKEVWLAMAHVPNGDLSVFCPALPSDRSAIAEARQAGLISPRTADLLQRSITQDVLTRLASVQQHSQVRHMDFRPENLYLDANGSPLIGDLGTATTGQVGFIPDAAIHMAPESAVAHGNAQALGAVTGKADVYGAGTLVLRMLAGRETFANIRWDAEKQDALRAFYASRNGYNQLTQAQRDALAKCDMFVVDQANNRVTLNVSADPTANALANSLLHPDPNQRPTPQAALQHAWFRPAALSTPQMKQELQAVTAILSKPAAQRTQAELARVTALSAQIG